MPGIGHMPGPCPPARATLRASTPAHQPPHLDDLDLLHVASGSFSRVHQDREGAAWRGESMVSAMRPHTCAMASPLLLTGQTHRI